MSRQPAADTSASVGQAGLERLLIQIGAAINTRTLYAGQHPRVAEAIGLVRSAVTTVCEDNRQDGVTLLLIGDELVVDRTPLRRARIYPQPVIRALRRRGIERLTLGHGLEDDECRALIEALAVGGVPRSTAHVVVGQIELLPPGDDGVPAGAHGPGFPDLVRAPAESGLRTDLIENAREAFVRVRRDPRAGVARLDDLVWSFMEAIERAGGSVLPLAPLRHHDEYTFVHSVNVAILVLAQGRSLGFQGQVLHAIGAAALLHDIGKLRISLDVLNKPGRLDEPEWRIMQAHAAVGAHYLCGVDHLPHLAIVVAYEHHLRFDAEPNYPLLRSPRRPGLASQMTAIADAYDAICTTRPYKPAQSRPAALEILTARAGTFYDPFLVANFKQVLGVAQGT